MNVSSVKNLNGETFSAVQDAALTDVVQTNSGNWQDITAYQNASAGYLTAHQDLSNYYTTADANTMSGMLSGAIDYVSANAGDEFPASANEAITAYQNASGTYLTAVSIPESADWSESTNYVQTNSGAIDETVGAVESNSGNWSFVPTYEYTDGDLISAIDTSGLYATSAGTANHALWIPEGKRLDQNVYWSGSEAAMYLNPKYSPFTTTSGVFGMLQYATGASLDYYSQSNGNQYYGGFFKGNQWFVSDNNPTNPNKGSLMGEIHRSRNINISGALVSGGGFVLHPDHVSGRGNSPTTNSWKLDKVSVSGLNSTGSWKYGVEEDTALRTVSALEYNAVDEISGIAGSAIAQYGADKQWLQHDDTIVHVANSAQYAFGVAIDNVARLMGVDQTELWSGTMNTTGQSATLSEPISSFNNIEITIKDQNGYSNIQKFETDASGYNTSMLTQYPGRNNTFIQRLAFLTVPDQNHLRYTSGCRAVISGGTPDFQMSGPTITRVVGIGRKQ